MSEVTQPRKARRSLAPVAVVAAALIALLAFAPLASAAPDPVASGSTQITLNKGLNKQLTQLGIKITATKPATLKGLKATFPVTGASFDPTTGSGLLIHSGGLKVTWGKKSVAIRSLEIETAKKGLFGKVAGKKMKIATLAGISFAREGFGSVLSAKKLKLTGNAAVTLDKKLAPPPAKPKKNKGKKGHKGASKSEAIAAPFKANANFGSAKASEQPSTTTLLPTGNMTFNLDSGLAKKLSEDKVEIQPQSATVSGTSYTFGITGGTFGPTGTSGTVQTAGGLKLVQKLPNPLGAAIETEITLGGFWYDLQQKTISVEVTAVSNAESPAGSGKKPLNLGALGRSSVADVTLGTVATEPVARTVSVQNSGANLQAVAAEALNGFTQVWAGYKELTSQLPVILGGEGLTPDQAKAKAAQILAENTIAGGNAMGSISFSGQAQ